jgi:nicotinate-nucleotide adenylyltransferase
MRLGIFGGSFDPVHRGHVLLAECCRVQAGLDRVWLVPAAQQPFKPRGPIAPAADRVAMLRLAVAGHEELEVSTLEIDRGGMSYTIDTLEAVAAAEPAARLFLLMGADTLADLAEWHRPAAICALATPLVVSRAGEPPPAFEHLAPLVSAERLAEIQALQVEMPLTPISSSAIRDLLASGGDWQNLVDPTVAQFIKTQGLYR